MSMITTLLKPQATTRQERKVWGIELESVWVPFFVAARAEGVLDSETMPDAALGAPLRLRTDSDGNVRFRDGRPVYGVAPEIKKGVRVVQDNFKAQLLGEVARVRKSHGAAFKATVAAAAEAREGVYAAEAEALERTYEAMAATEAVAQAMAAANGHRQSEEIPA